MIRHANRWIWSAVLVSAVAAHAEDRSAKVHFRSGVDLVERNAGDAHGKSKAKLEEGIAELQTALDGEYEPKAEVYRQLARAYAGLATFGKGPSSDKGKYHAKALEALERVIALDAQDVKSRALYVSWIEQADPARALQIYDQILSVEPRNGDALWGSAVLLERAGQEAKALDRAEKAAEVLDASDARSYGSRVVDFLRDHGREKAAEKWERVLNERASKAPADHE